LNVQLEVKRCPALLLSKRQLAWIIHDECRPRRKLLILLSYAAGAESVEFSGTKSSARPFP
jgi:hypothetical protein